MSVAHIGEECVDKWEQNVQHVVYDRENNRWIVNPKIKTQKKKTTHLWSKTIKNRFAFLDFN